MGTDKPGPKPDKPGPKPAPPGAPAAHLKPAAAPSPAPAKPPAPPPASSKPRVVGMAGGGEEKPAQVAAEAKKLLESTKSALGGLFAKAQAKIAEIQHKEQPAAAAPEPAAATEAAPAEASEPAPPPAVAAKPLAPAHQKPAGMDRLVIKVAEGTAQKAQMILARKGIKDAKVEGDRLEFRYAANRVSQVFKALIEAHVELYGLERTPEPAAAGPGPASPTAGAASAPPEAGADAS